MTVYKYLILDLYFIIHDFLSSKTKDEEKRLPSRRQEDEVNLFKIKWPNVRNIKNRK